FTAAAPGTAPERPSRVARNTCPNPPSPSIRSTRYSRPVSELAMTCAGARSGAIGLSATPAERPRVVADVAYMTIAILVARCALFESYEAAASRDLAWLGAARGAQV